MVLAKIYKDSIRYAKAGVMLLGICQHDEIQLNLFNRKEASEANTYQKQALMSVMDKLNTRYKADNLFVASEARREK